MSLQRRVRIHPSLATTIPLVLPLLRKLAVFYSKLEEELERIRSRLGSLSIFSNVSPGPLGYFDGPQTWYMKYIHRPKATSPNTRTGLAMAMLCLSCALFKRRVCFLLNFNLKVYRPPASAQLSSSTTVLNQGRRSSQSRGASS